MDKVVHKDNLKLEGTMEKRSQQKWAPGERANVVKHSDNLKMQGKLNTSRQEWATKGERVERVVHEDNLKMEGQMQGKLVSFKYFTTLIRLKRLFELKSK